MIELSRKTFWGNVDRNHLMQIGILWFIWHRMCYTSGNWLLRNWYFFSNKSFTVKELVGCLIWFCAMNLSFASEIPEMDQRCFLFYSTIFVYQLSCQIMFPIGLFNAILFVMASPIVLWGISSCFSCLWIGENPRVILKWPKRELLI